MSRLARAGWKPWCAALLVLLLVQVAARHRDRAIELGPPRLWSLSAGLRQQLARLDTPVLATLFVSDASTMPSVLRHLEPDLRTLLGKMEQASDGWLVAQVSHPDAQPADQPLAARFGVAPIRAESILQDAWKDQELWCALVVEQGRRAPLVLPSLQPTHLPHLQERVHRWLGQAGDDVPILGLIAPPSDQRVREQLQQYGPVRELAANDLPHTDADLLLWLDPGPVTAETRRQLGHWLASGRSVVLAPPARAVEPMDGDWNQLRFPAQEVGGVDALLRDHGIQRRPELVLDRRCGVVTGNGSEPLPLPFRVSSIAPHQDFREYRLTPNGHLWFEAPAALWPVSGQAADPDLRHRVLAATSDQTWLRPWPTGPLALASLDQGTPAARQPLVVQVDRPADPLHGTLVVLADASPFSDHGLTRPEAAHARLLESLVTTLAAPERIAWSRARSLPERLASPGRTTRTAWRFLVLALVPLLLAACGAWKARHGLTRRPDRRVLRHATVACGGLVLLGGLWLLVGPLLRAAEPRADLTSEGRHRPARITQELARGDGSPLEVEWHLSGPAQLPAPLRLPVRSLHHLLRDLQRAGAPMALQVVDPAEQAEAPGVFHCTLHLRRHGREERLTFTTPREFESADFRLAFALWRLQEGRAVTVAFASDTPRPSAAEAYEEYQTQGLMPPAGTDVYHRSRQLLEQAGFTLQHVNPRAPRLDEAADALVWLQPRRNVHAMLEQTASYLHQGGRVLLAAQPFRMQARQYPGTGFDVVYWPEPQHPDVDRYYFPELGVQLAREVVCDRLTTLQEQDARVHGRGPRRQFSAQPSALPFQVRGSSAHADPRHAITRSLGDQCFSGTTWLQLDADRLAQQGLRAQVLWTTSAESWGFPWEKGWLPPEVLAGDGEPRPQVPVLALVEGRFPEYTPPDREATPHEPATAEGRLLFLACSEVFRDEVLARRHERGDRLMVAAVAGLTLPPELAALAGRARVDRGFGLVTPTRQLVWRASVIGGMPLLLVLLGLARSRRGKGRPS